VESKRNRLWTWGVLIQTISVVWLRWFRWIRWKLIVVALGPSRPFVQSQCGTDITSYRYSTSKNKRGVVQEHHESGHTFAWRVGREPNQWSSQPDTGNCHSCLHNHNWSLWRFWSEQTKSTQVPEQPINRLNTMYYHQPKMNFSCA